MNCENFVGPQLLNILVSGGGDGGSGGGGGDGGGSDGGGVGGGDGGVGPHLLNILVT